MLPASEVKPMLACIDFSIVGGMVGGEIINKLNLLNMKKLSEMKIAKDAILSPIEASAKGGRNVTGDTTTYYGPSAPTTITTYVDGMYWGSDPHVGSLFGDWWAIDKPMTITEPAKLFIKKG